MIRSDVPLGEGWTWWPALGLTCLALGMSGIAALRFSPPPPVPPTAPMAPAPAPPPPMTVTTPTVSAPAPAPDCPPLLAFHFAAGAAIPLSTPDVEVELLVAWLARHPEAQVVANGHADANGSVGRNLALSHARAANAAQWLVERGLPKLRITARGFGAYQPLPGEDEVADRNRRVEVRVLGQPHCSRGDEP